MRNDVRRAAEMLPSCFVSPNKRRRRRGETRVLAAVQQPSRARAPAFGFALHSQYFFDVRTPVNRISMDRGRSNWKNAANAADIHTDAAFFNNLLSTCFVCVESAGIKSKNLRVMLTYKYTFDIIDDNQRPAALWNLQLYYNTKYRFAGALKLQSNGIKFYAVAYFIFMRCMFFRCVLFCLKLFLFCARTLISRAVRGRRVYTMYVHSDIRPETLLCLFTASFNFRCTSNVQIFQPTHKSNTDGNYELWAIVTTVSTFFYIDTDKNIARGNRKKNNETL